MCAYLFAVWYGLLSSFGYKDEGLIIGGVAAVFLLFITRPKERKWKSRASIRRAAKLAADQRNRARFMN